MFKRSTALKTPGKTRMVKCNFSNTIGSRPKAYPDVKEMFPILALFFMSDDVTVFISCKP